MNLHLFYGIVSWFLCTFATTIHFLNMTSGGDIDKWATIIQHVEYRDWLSMFEVKSTWTSRLSGL